MIQSKLMVALFALAGLTMTAGVMAQGTTKATRDMAVTQASAQYKADKATCTNLSGNANDICIQAAKGKEQVAKAEAEATYANTPKARENARVVRANATYAVSKEKCDDVAGNVKDVCVKEAKAALVRAKADAKVDRVATDAQTQAIEKTAEARKDASTEKRDADYKVAVEKCDVLAGVSKDSCVQDAKGRYGKS